MKRLRGRPPKDDVVADVESALMMLIHRSKPDSTVADVAEEIARERQRAVEQGTAPEKAVKTRSVRTIRKRLQNFQHNERANREAMLRAKIDAFREKYKRSKGLN